MYRELTLHPSNIWDVNCRLYGNKGFTFRLDILVLVGGNTWGRIQSYIACVKRSYIPVCMTPQKLKETVMFLKKCFTHTYNVLGKKGENTNIALVLFWARDNTMSMCLYSMYFV